MPTARDFLNKKENAPDLSNFGMTKVKAAYRSGMERMRGGTQAIQEFYNSNVKGFYREHLKRQQRESLRILRVADRVKPQDFVKRYTPPTFRTIGSTARQTVHAAMDKFDKWSSGRRAKRLIRKQAQNVVKKGPGRKAFLRIASKWGGRGMITLGATAMLALGVMRGMGNQSRDVIYQRYLQDSRYSRNMLTNSRIGLSSGTNKMMQYGDTRGLSNALSRTRHGGY